MTLFIIVVLLVTCLTIGVILWLAGLYERGRPSNEELPRRDRDGPLP